MPTSTSRTRFIRGALGAGLLLAGTAAHADGYGAAVLHAFGAGDGDEPQNLTAGPDGNYYGVGISGGVNGSGTIFRITPDGSFTLLYSFSPTAGFPATNPDGYLPEGLTLGKDGNFYGTAQDGGAYGLGTVFRITPDGTFTLLHTFIGGSEGTNPVGRLVLGQDGKLYGVTFAGGLGAGGTVFRLEDDGSISTIGNFPNGTSPTHLIQAGDGNFYGTTQYGGSAQVGIIFKMTPDGTITTLHDFNPYGYPSSLLQGADGNLYGTTNMSPSVVFQLTLDGQYTVLHTHTQAWTALNNADGDYYQGLVQGADGTLYGVARAYGPYGTGVAFQLTTAGQFTALDFFGTSATDVDTPLSLLIGADGGLYGTSAYGGDGGGHGTIFHIDLPPPDGWGSSGPTLKTVVLPATIHQSQNQSATLAWSAPGADACYLNSNDGAANDLLLPAKGSMTVQPPIAGRHRSFVYTYAVDCAGNGVAVESEASLTVKKR